MRASYVIDCLRSLDPLLQAILATAFAWAVTATGAALVFFTAKLNRRLLDATVGFGAGVMVAASFWSLLEPGIALASKLEQITWLTAAGGVLMQVNPIPAAGSCRSARAHGRAMRALDPIGFMR
jgi:ZIP family zinc transporter